MTIGEPSRSQGSWRVLELLAELNATHQRTIVMVLHELNEAARYSHNLVAMRAGAVVAESSPAEVVTTDTLRTVFGIDSKILDDPVTGTPLVVPIACDDRSARGRVQ